MATADGRKDSSKNPVGNGQPAKPAETTSAYFRRVLTETPTLLDAGNNRDALNRWLKDHPEEKVITNKLRANLANMKSLLRKEVRALQARKVAEQIVHQHGASTPPIRRAGHKLENLEEQIDDVLTLAKNIDRNGLHHVIDSLRHARNLVVWRMGK